MDSLREKDTFTENNLPLVHSLCRRFTGKGIEYDDLFGAGCIGLVKAVEKYDANRGFSFSTYAVPVILGEIRRLFRDGGSVKISRSVKELYLKAQKAKERLERSLSREPTLGEIAEYIGADREDVCFAANAMQPTVSLTGLYGENEKQTDLPAPPGTERLLDKITLEQAINTLDDEEALIIKLRYYNCLTQQQAARRLNMTQVQISRKEKKILLKMRALIGAAS